MKEISLRELHRNTGKWVRSARKHGAIVVRDRNVPVAKIVGMSDQTRANPFARWTPLKRFAAALARPVGGTPVEQIISDDRGR
jgi:prevent-host-death family protein